MFPLILENRISLCFLNEADSRCLHQLISKNRAYLKEFLPWLDFSNSIEDSQEFIKKTTIENNAGIALTLGIRDDGQLIGIIGYHAFDRDNNCAGIGYWLDQEQQGRGVITLACKHLIQYGFSHIKLDKIKISCATTNAKSNAIPERLGFFRKEMIPKKEWLYDHFVDHFSYEITLDEWLDLTKRSSIR